MSKRLRLVIFGVLGILATIALVGGTVTALYQDVEVAKDNQFTGGILDLSSCGNRIIVNDVKPGFHNHGGNSINDGMIGIQTYTNEGNNPGMIGWQIVNVRNTEGLNPEPETNIVEPGDLGGVLYVAKVVFGTGLTYDPVDNDFYVTGIVKEVFLDKTINDLGDDPPLDVGLKIEVGQTIYSEIFWYVPSSVGNEIMGDVCLFDINMILNQMPV